MKLLLFLATQKGYCTLKGIIDTGFTDDIGLVVSFHETNVVKDWCEDIRVLCERVGIDFLLWKDIRESIAKVINSIGITNAIAVSWKFMINSAECSALKEPLIVFHDSLLPKYRGFAPIPTAMICGDTTVGVTALYAVDKVDAGPIISQSHITIDNSMYVQDVIDRISELYADMTVNIIHQIKTGKELSLTYQDESLAVYSIWRSPDDCHIDWNQSSNDIYNFIRAVSSPYPGAFTYYGNEKIIINCAEIAEDITFAIRQPGKLWSIEDNKPMVICGKGMLRITEAVNINGNKLIFNHLRERLN